MFNPLRKLTSQAAIWPPIDYELADLRHLLKGKVLNAGAGWREIGHLIDGELVNQDLPSDNETRTNIHILSPLANIPRPDHSFDAVVCIAVLEHVENPEQVVAEMFRVLKPGGHLIASVPFLQPEHKVPTDYQRYTRDGLERTLRNGGFEIVRTEAMFSVYHTLHWILFEALRTRNGLTTVVLRNSLLPTLALLARRSQWKSDVVASAFRSVARRPATG